MNAEHVATQLKRVERMLDDQHDVADFLIELIDMCRYLLNVDAVGIMLLSRGSQLQLFAASSHHSAELELHQSQIDEGPCVDAITSAASVSVAGSKDLISTWPTFGPAMVDKGFTAVHSFPLTWGETVLGGMALFRKEPATFEQDENDAAQALADLVSRLVMDGDSVADSTDDRIEAALGTRAAVELAKGTIAEEGNMTMGDAFDRLRALATKRGLGITEVAEDLVAKAAEGPVDITL